ncbi:MAG: aminotransferase class I/II-fold pyridoxal phosphate-dependent enzyme [Christensenellaceae bacterium]|jgi:aminotransferase|nr:aminotransferase class I/II-fold pyridoxal phosphate-dependent enzyme [Christensenellaceae bacterium]
MQPLSNKTAKLSDSVIRRMTRISLDCGAINLSQGFPDFDPPKALMDRLAQVAYEGPHQYSPTWGNKNYRDALCKKQTQFLGIPLDSDDNILATCGSTEAMMAALMAITNPGDKIVLFSPFFENYAAQSLLLSTESIYIPLTPPSYDFDPNQLEDAFKQGAKAMILCNPSNPSGKVFTYDELKTIADLAIKYDVYVITDEVYEHIVYEPNKYTYMAALPGMWERTICCSSLSKTYSITGWRLGYVVACKEIVDRCKKMHDFLTVCAPSPLQEAAIAGLSQPLSYYDELRDHYTHMKQIFTDGLRNLNINFTDPQGAYFVMVDISEFSHGDDVQFCEDLAHKVGVGAVPGSSFFKEDVRHLARFHFAKKDETLYAALDRLSSIREKMK